MSCLFILQYKISDIIDRYKYSGEKSIPREQPNQNKE